jgi:predicted transcriptional regulator
MIPYRRSKMQTEVLLQLAENNSPTITDLAERMQVERSSLSRSMKLLKEQGLIERTRQGWRATDSGKEEAHEAQQTMIEVAGAVRNTLERTQKVIAGIDLNSGFISQAIAAIQPLAFKDWIPKYNWDRMIDHFYVGQTVEIAEAIQSIANSHQLAAITTQASLIGTIERTINDSVTVQFQRIVKPLWDVQASNAELMKTIGEAYSSPLFRELAKQQNFHVSYTIDAVLRINSLVQQQQVSSGLENLIAGMSQVTSALDRLWQDSLPIQLPDTSFAPRWIASQFTLPTTTVSHYANSLASFVEAEVIDESDYSSDRTHYEFQNERLDLLLARFDNDFVEMRLGAWHALNTAGPDSIRHAGTSFRELLRQLLLKLVPDLELTKEKAGKPSIKARVKGVLKSDSDAEYVDALVGAVFQTYNQLNKYTHHNEKHAEGLRGIIMATEGLILFLLSKIE